MHREQRVRLSIASPMPATKCDTRCPAYNYFHSVSDVTISLTMDCFNQPPHGDPTQTIYTQTSNNLTASLNSATPAPNNKNVLFYIIQNKTKVPQTQTQHLNAILKPDITGTLGLLDGNKWTASFDKLVKNTTNVYLNNVSFQSTPNVLFTDSVQKYNNPVHVPCNKDHVLSIEKENKINNVYPQCDVNPYTQHTPQTTGVNKETKQLQTVTINDRIFCKLCFKKFAKKNVFDEHYRTSHPDENIIYTCSICRNEDKVFDKFRNHYYRHFKTGRLRCSLCPDYQFTQEEHCKNHIRIFHPKEYEENQITKRNDSSIEKAAETQIDKPISLFCSVCKTKFTEKEVYDDHYKNVHSYYAIFYECFLCLRGFKTFKNFKNHMCTPKSHLKSTVEKYESLLEKQQTNEVLGSLQNSTLVEEVNPNMLFDQSDMATIPSKETLENNVDSCAHKDPTLAMGMKENAGWDPLLNNFNYKGDSALDENQNSDKILNKNNDLFTADVGESCDLFENIRFSPNIFTNLFSNGLDQMESADPPNKESYENNSEICEKTNTDEQKSNMTEYKSQVSIESGIETESSEGALSSEINNDFLASLIPEDLLEFAENMSLQDLNKSLDNSPSNKFCEGDRDLIKNNNNNNEVTNHLNAAQCRENNDGSLKSDHKTKNTKKFNARIKSKESYLMCYICKRDFTKKDALSEHMNTDHPSWHVIYECRFCHFEEHNFQKYDKHVCHVLISTRKTCRICTDHKNVFESSEELLKHMNLEHKDDRKSGWVHNGYLCIKCKKKFPKKNLFDSHYQEMHSSKVVYTCAWCYKSYKKFASFRSHCYSHIMAGRFRCPYCEKSFTKQSKLSAHMKVVHFGENCSTTATSAPSSNISYSPQSNMSYLMSPYSESSQTNMDVGSLAGTPVGHQDTSVEMDNDGPISNILCDDVNMTQSDIEDSMSLMLSPSETFSILNSVESINYDSTQHEFEEDDDSQITSNNIELDFMNSPESGIDCMNSPSSDFQYTHDYRDSPLLPDIHYQSPLKMRESSESGCTIQVSCGVCWQIFPSRSVVEDHFRRDHKSLNVSYACIVCKDVSKSYEAFLSHWCGHGSQENKAQDSQTGSANRGINSPGCLDEGLCEMGGDISSGDSWYQNIRSVSHASPTNRKRKNYSDECIKKIKMTSELKLSQNEQILCQHCSTAFEDQLDLLQHLQKQHTFVHNNDMTEMIKQQTLGERTVASDCFKTKPLSKYKLDNCIQSVINTSEDFKHSVICYEYNKGIKYNDIVRCNNDKFSKEALDPCVVGQAKPSQRSHSKTHDKQTPNNLDLSVINSQIHVSTVQQLDSELQTQLLNNRQHCYKEQCQDFNTSLGENTETLPSLLSLLSNNKVIEANNSTGDLIMITRNDEDLNIVVNNKKTEDIQSRHIISDQRNQPSNTGATYIDTTGKQSSLTHQLFANSKSAVMFVNASQPDNTANKLEHQIETNMENQIQSDEQLLHLQTPYNQSNESNIASTLGRAHILYSNKSDDNVIYAIGQQSDDCNAIQQPEKRSPLVLSINIIVPTSSTNDLRNNTNSAHYIDNVVTIDSPHYTDNVVTIDSPHYTDNVVTIDSPHYTDNVVTIDSPHCTDNVVTIDSPHYTDNVVTIDSPHYTDNVVTINPTQNITSLPKSLVILTNNNSSNVNCFNSNELLLPNDVINTKDLNNLREFRHKPKQTPPIEISEPLQTTNEALCKQMK